MALPIGEALVITLRVLVCTIAGFVGAFWVLSALLDRKLSGREAALIAVGLLALILWAVALAFRGWLGPLLISATILVLYLLGRLLVAFSTAQLERTLEEEDIRRYRAALAFDPRNVAAHSLLAETYRRAGQLEAAIAEYRAALQLDPSLREERYWMVRLEAEIERRERKEMLCPRCGLPRPARAAVCPECGRPYSSLEVWLHAYRGRGPAARAALAAVLAVAAVGLAAAFALVPGGPKVMLALVLLGGPLWMLIAARRAGGGAS